MKSLMRAAVALLVLAACTNQQDGRETQPQTTSSSPIDAAAFATENCDYGPWARYCPEAYWARAVIAEAGYRLEGDTGSALVVDMHEAGAYFWAFEPDDPSVPLPKAIADEGYERLVNIERSHLYTDGIRIAWQIHGLYVWLEGGPVNSIDDVNRRVLRRLVAAARRVPYPLPAS
jgi:hypothetical protein